MFRDWSMLTGNVMLALYFSPGSSSMAVHIALHEIGIDFERRPVSFTNREQHSPEYLAVNPEGKVPALVIDGGPPLTEVAAILYFLAKRHPEARLWPEGGLEAEAQAISWMSFIASTIHPARRIGVERWREVFGIAERRLGGREWTVERYSVADIHLFRLYWRFVNSVKPEPGEFPALSAHYDRMMARPAVQRTIEIESAVGYALPQ
jgi:glutathione S-transferase